MPARNVRSGAVSNIENLTLDEPALRTRRGDRIVLIPQGLFALPRRRSRSLSSAPVARPVPAYLVKSCVTLPLRMPFGMTALSMAAGVDWDHTHDSKGTRNPIIFHNRNVLAVD